MTKDYFEKIGAFAAREVARAIRSRVMCEQLKDAGWTEIIIPNMDETKSKWIARNLKKSLKGKYYGFYDQWVFELEEDALWFRLKWTYEPNKQ